MKTKALVSCLLFLFALTASVMGLAGFDLKEPQLAFPAGFPESDRTNIMASLSRPDCKFVGGSFINSFTSLKYSGDTPALNMFIEGLVKFPGSVLFVRFHTDRASDNCDWIVSHMADEPRQFTVHVNMKSSAIRMGELVIPESKGPPLFGPKK